MKIIEAVCEKATEPCIRFVLTQIEKISDRIKDDPSKKVEVEKIENKRLDLERIINNRNINKFKCIMRDLRMMFPKEDIDSVLAIMTWINDQLNTDHELEPMGQLIILVIQEKIKYESSTKRKQTLLGLDRRLWGKIRDYREANADNFKDKEEKLFACIRETSIHKILNEKTHQNSVQSERNKEDKMIHILHLSDIHLKKGEQKGLVYRSHLLDDLQLEPNLNLDKLDYIVISGDIGHYSTEDEYNEAFQIIDNITRRFHIDFNRVIAVPGNHDLNWDLSKKAYSFKYADEITVPCPDDHKISCDNAGGVLLRDEQKYQDRFNNFSEYFFKKLNNDAPYPSDYEQQGILYPMPEDKILFLGLNSCWNIDHHYKERSGINTNALTRAFDKIDQGNYNGWLKIAVWHHPVTGPEMMKNPDFLEHLVAHGFKICMYGHIHRAIKAHHKKDDDSGIRIVGAGTFGAPAEDQQPGIPLQYSLLTYYPERCIVKVESRRKETPDGEWEQDPRWKNNENNLVPYYEFDV